MSSRAAHASAHAAVATSATAVGPAAAWRRRRVGGVVALLIALGASQSPAAQPAAAAAPPSAPIAWRPVAPDIEQVHLVRQTDAGGGTAAGPWSIHALRIDLTQVRVDAFRALDEAVGLETVSSLAQRHGAVAAINGGFFRTTGTFRGESVGTLLIDGTLLSEPESARSAVGFVRSGSGTRLVFGRVGWDGAVTVAGKRRALDGLNRPRGQDEVILFTPAFHRTTLTDDKGLEVVVRRGRVERIREEAGSTPIPPDGFVLSVTGSARQWARETLRPRTKVAVTLALKPAQVEGPVPADPTPNPWMTAEDVVGAGPKLVTAGRVDITNEREKRAPAFSTTRHPRTAIGSLADGRALLVVVDGRQPALSVGMSLDELARLLIELGAVEGMNLDGGGSSAMVVQGQLVNHPSDAAGERPVSDAILVRAR